MVPDEKEIYVVIYTENNSICYCGHDHNEANKLLEMPHYAKEEADKYQLTIYQGGRLVNEAIKRKIKR